MAAQNWTENNNKLQTNLKFKTTIEALDFIKKVSLLADSENHHPRIVFQYRTVLLELQTHDAGNIITKKDHDLAKKIDMLL